MHIKLRKKYTLKKLKLSEKFILMFILIIIGLIFLFRYISNTVTPVLLNYAEIESKKFMNVIINKSINESNIEDLDKLITLKENNGVISTIDFNVNIVNNMLAKIGEEIEKNMKLLEIGELKDIPGYDNDDLAKGIIYRLPSGLFLKDNVISNIGPRIPVKIDLRGSITTNIDTKLTDYGINNALIEIFINISLEEDIMLPYTVKRVVVENRIPIVLKVVEGVVPKYYSNGINSTSPSFSIPMEEN